MVHASKCSEFLDRDEQLHCSDRYKGMLQQHVCGDKWPGLGWGWGSLERRQLLKGEWSACPSAIHSKWNHTNQGEDHSCVWQSYGMATCPESVWTNDHFNHSDLEIFTLVSTTCCCHFSSQSSSRTSFQTSPGNHSFLLQPQLPPFATLILSLHSPCLQV